MRVTSEEGTFFTNFAVTSNYHSLLGEDKKDLLRMYQEAFPDSGRSAKAVYSQYYAARLRAGKGCKKRVKLKSSAVISTLNLNSTDPMENLLIEIRDYVKDTERENALLKEKLIKLETQIAQMRTLVLTKY